MLLQWQRPPAQALLVCLAVASSSGMLPLYPRPALYDMQLTSSIRVSVEFRGIVQDVHTTFTFHSHSQCVKGETYNYTVLVWQDGSSQPCHTEGPFPVASCEDLLDVTVYGLHRSQHYTAAVVAYNDHLSLRSRRVDVYTSAVQAVEVVEGEECMFVTCYFAAGSTAQGCQVQLRVVTSHSSQHLHSWQFNISRDPALLTGTLHLPLEPKTSALDVAVYDLTASGRVGFLSVPPHISHSSGLNCDLGETLTPFKAKARMALFYVSASFFILGLLIVCGGMLCKAGHLHRHFRNKSYEMLEGRGPHHRHYSSGTLSGDHEISSKTNERHLTRPQPESQSPDSLPSSSPKPRAKTYGSHDALGSPAARLLLNKAGEGGEKRWGGSLREGAERDAVLVSLHPHCEAGGREEAEKIPEVSAGHSVVREGGINPLLTE